MQTTLLGVAIVIILALVAALAGPLFIDWSRYHAQIETRAEQLTGLQFRIAGRIDARLLPTPTVTLHDVEFGGRGDGSKVRASALHLEYDLGALVRGEWRVEDARLEQPQFEIGLDAAGRVRWPLPSSGFAPQEVSIQRLTVRDGRAILADEAGGARLVLDKIEFGGSLRSLAGPIRGDGSFVADGRPCSYRLVMSRPADDGSLKVRFNIDPVDRSLSTDVNLSIWIDRSMPRFEGNITFARQVGRASDELTTAPPWHLAARVRGNGSAADLDQIELQYGWEERAIKLRGSARLTFGSHPQVEGMLSAPQIDLDRAVALPEEARRRPVAAVKALAVALADAPRWPVPLKLGLNVEALTVAGGTLQRAGAELRADGEIWHIDKLELRVPGLTQVRLSGRFDASSKTLGFKGPVRIDSGDPRALLAWLTDRADLQTPGGSFRLSGDFSLGGERIAIEGLDAEVDRMTVLGSLAYSWASNDRPARIEATLKAPELNVDRVQTITKAMLGDTAFDWPREGTLALQIGRILVGGVEAKQSDVRVRIDRDGLEIDELTIADVSGMALAAKGRIDTRGQLPRGAVTLNLDARSLEGVTMLVEKFAPQAADQLRRLGGRVSPVALRGTLELDPAATGSRGTTNASARFKVDGRAGTFKVALQGDTGIASDALKVDDLATLAAAEMNVSGRLDADDSATLIDLIGLERLIVADKRPGRLRIAAKGPLDGELAVDGQLAAGALKASANGMVHVSKQTGPAAALEIKIADANLRSPRPPAPGRETESLPASMTLALALGEGTLRLNDIKGTVAGASVAGRLTVEMQQQPVNLDGNLEVGVLDLAAALGTATGVPATASNEAPAGLWSAEPFKEGVRGVGGQIAIKAGRVPLLPHLAARDFQGTLYLGESQLALRVADGRLADGRLAGEVIFLRDGPGVIARTRLKLTDANLAEMFGDEAVSGRLAVEISAEGTGMSPIALVGALEGGGRITLTNARLGRLNPAAFESVIRAVDRGLPIDAARVGDRMASALAGGALGIRRAESGISIEGGQARMLSNPVLATPDVDLAVNAHVNLAEGILDTRLTLSAVPGKPAKTWPEVVVTLKGPIDAPRRTIDVSTFTSWLALRAVEQQSKKLDVLEGGEAAGGTPTADPPGAGRPTAPGRRQPRRIGVRRRRGRPRCPEPGLGRDKTNAERGTRARAISPLISPLPGTSPDSPG